MSPPFQHGERRAGPRGPDFAFARRYAGVMAGMGLALGLAACRAEVEKKVVFQEADHASYLAKGKASVEGEAFLRRPNGWLARCSGGIVYLVPATPYFREWVEVYRSGARLANAAGLNESHGKAIRKTQCDMQGRFTFAELPAGRWIIVTRITYSGTEWNSDSTLVAEIETKAGDVAKAILSNPNRI